jgi:hypothetical protein
MDAGSAGCAQSRVQRREGERAAFALRRRAEERERARGKGPRAEQGKRCTQLVALVCCWTGGLVDWCCAQQEAGRNARA